MISLSAEAAPNAPIESSRGLRTSLTSGSADTRLTTSPSAFWNAGLLVVSVRLWTSTVSSAGVSKLASRIRSIRPDSPDPSVSWSSCFVPTVPPMTTAAVTNASHPKVAVFQCEALQRPAPAARLSFMGASLHWFAP
jgi:hypothetical protein